MARDSRVDDDIGEIRSFVERNRECRTLSEWFPHEPLSRLAEVVELPDELALDLLELLRMARRYDDHVDGRGRNCYEGADLHRLAAVVRVLARLATPTESMAREVAGMLGANTYDRHYARPGGSPDIDKYDRDCDVERAQDVLAFACAEALARLGKAEPHVSMEALHAAQDHRYEEVRFVARQVLRLIEDEMPRERLVEEPAQPTAETPGESSAKSPGKMAEGASVESPAESLDRPSEESLKERGAEDELAEFRCLWCGSIAELRVPRSANLSARGLGYRCGACHGGRWARVGSMREFYCWTQQDDVCAPGGHRSKNTRLYRLTPTSPSTDVEIPQVGHLIIRCCPEHLELLRETWPEHRVEELT